MDSSSEDESSGGSPTNQIPQHITAAVDDDEDAVMGSIVMTDDIDDDYIDDDDDDDNDNDDGDDDLDDDDIDDDDDLPVDNESQCLPFRTVGDYSDDGNGDRDDEDGYRDVDPLLFQSVEDLKVADDDVRVMVNNRCCSDDTLFLRDVPSPSQQRQYSSGDQQRLLDDDRPHFTHISKVPAIIEHFNSSITPKAHHQVSSITPTACHHQVSPSLTAQDTYSALVENTNCSYLLGSRSSNASTHNIHGISTDSVGTVVATPLLDLHTIAAVEIKGTVSPLSVESADCNAAAATVIRRSYSRRQLGYHLFFTMGLGGEEFVQGVALVNRFNHFVGSVASTEGRPSRPVSITTAVVGVLHVAVVIGLALLVSAIISLTNVVGSMITSMMIMMYRYLLLTPWRWMLFTIQRVLALPRWLITRQLCFNR